MLRALSLSLALTCAFGCADLPAGDPSAELDGEFDDVGDGKADTGGIKPDTIESYAVVTFANYATRAEMKAAGLGKTAIANMMAVRDGDDGKPLTNDDWWFPTLEALDAVPFVGPAAFKAMLTYARERAFYTRPAIDGKWTFKTESTGGVPSLIFLVELKVQDNGGLVKDLRLAGQAGAGIAVDSFTMEDGFVAIAREVPALNAIHYAGLDMKIVNGTQMCGRLRVSFREADDVHVSVAMAREGSPYPTCN